MWSDCREFRENQLLSQAGDLNETTVQGDSKVEYFKHLRLVRKRCHTYWGLHCKGSFLCYFKYWVGRRRMKGKFLQAADLTAKYF